MSNDRSTEYYDALADQVAAAHASVVQAKAAAITAILTLLKAAAHYQAQLRMVKVANAGRIWSWVRRKAGVDPETGKACMRVKVRDSGDDLSSYNLRVLGIMTTAAKRQSQRRARTNNKSWVYYLSKSQDPIAKLIDEAGGIRGLTKMEKMSIMAHIQPLVRLSKELNRE